MPHVIMKSTVQITISWPQEKEWKQTYKTTNSSKPGNTRAICMAPVSTLWGTSLIRCDDVQQWRRDDVLYYDVKMTSRFIFAGGCSPLMLYTNTYMCFSQSLLIFVCIRFFPVLLFISRLPFNNDDFITSVFLSVRSSDFSNFVYVTQCLSVH